MDTAPDPKAQRRAIVAENFAARFGQHWRSHVARALGFKLTNISRMFSPGEGRDDAPSETMLALSELLLILPDERLPPRWRQSAESGKHS